MTHLQIIVDLNFTKVRDQGSFFGYTIIKHKLKY